jgi:signal peptidase I
MTGMRSPRGRTLLTVAALLVAAWFVLPSSLGGQSGYVITHGISMEPRFHTGDLAVVRAASTYRVGDVVAYSNHSLHTTVLHRIVAIAGGHYVFKGDNNTFRDPEHPQRDQLIGTLVLRVPQGGLWLNRLASPLGIALAVFALLATGTRTSKHRDRRRQGSATMTPPHTPSRVGIAATSSAAGRVVLAGAAVLAALGLLLALVAWKAPRAAEAASITTATATPTVTFAYRAVVPHTAAYDTDTVTSPDPVFRRLANQVDVSVRYTGPAGTMAVTADVNAPSGWHTHLNLLPATTFAGTTHQASLRLNLNSLDQRAKAAAQVIAMPYDQLTIALVATIHTRDSQQLTPTLALTLTPQQLKLAGPPASLTVTGPPTQAPSAAPSAATVQLLGRAVDVHTTTWLALGLLLAAGAIALSTLVVFGRPPRDEAQAILAGYADLLLPVKAPTATHHGPSVDVQNFTALARTAQRHGLVIMTWAADGGQTFVVQDHSVRYRYTTTPPVGRSRRERHQRSESTSRLPRALSSVEDKDRDAG